ncbi:MAG: transcription elongation factor GreA [Thermoflexales bacterium]|nr:transcription elongation factor GreA [Thermoflexales bacterium]MCS7324740.1 transcription elongation factor GreA [Thermoflexales bacterium]MCX7939722.1 transcription elongation factor GreA [Thermoflexales bacterium]MDW8053064.1 transcription elongation factor GreA [Anaerolineae bacterium]MDW8291717.1 transcription elongation factor GreA [Anaerolineae bacterium]
MSVQQDSSKVYLTREGAQKIRDELAYLRDVKRPELAARLRAAIQQGDLSENADYTAAKEEQAFLEGRILQLENLLANAEILPDEAQVDGEVRIGSRVTVVEEGFGDEETFQIVGAAEADPLAGKISNVSPLGQALIGKRVGAKVRVNTPNGLAVFRIVRVE